jgi:hypothetical protein
MTPDAHAPVDDSEVMFKPGRLFDHRWPIDIGDQVRHTLSDVELINVEYLLQDNQRVVDFLEARTQEDTQTFISLLEARLDQEWEARKAVATTRRIPRRPSIYTYVERLGINPSFIRQHYELPIVLLYYYKRRYFYRAISFYKGYSF